MRWNDEPLKAVFTFDNGSTYEVFTYGGNDKFLVDVSKHEIEQVNYNNLFGSINSNSIRLRVFDLNNLLDINNTASPYYGYMRNGVKIELFISYDETSWDKYGTFYVTGWHDKFFDGMQDVVDITAEDELRYIMNNDIPRLSAYSGIYAGELIRNVLVGCGIDSNRIKISKDLDLRLRLGITDNSKVGYFLNEICQALCAVIVINDDNEILVMPALQGYNKIISLSDDYIETIATSNNTNSIYTKVKCTYDQNKATYNGKLVSSLIDLDAGVNQINNLCFGRRVISVTEIGLDANDKTGSLDIVSFRAYQDGIDISIMNNGEKLEDVDLYVLGAYADTVQNIVYSDVNYTDLPKNKTVTYEVYNKYVQTKEDAQKVTDMLARYIELMNTKIVIKTIYSPKVSLGDVLVFDSQFLEGKYKVIACDTVFGRDYSKNITMIPLRTNGVWDDSKSWDDNACWAENNELSLI